MASGCGSLAPTVPPPSAPVAPRLAPAVRSEPPAWRPAPGFSPAAVRAVELARSLLETPYRYGGSDPVGFDCSGLVSFVLRDVGVDLPRTAEAQSRAGRWVAPDELRPGDLVFFGDRDKPHHVGVVVSEAGDSLRMIHASTSQGVVETDVLRSEYWLERFQYGRRVLPAD